jgi:hypothetical protein
MDIKLYYFGLYLYVDIKIQFFFDDVFIITILIKFYIKKL